MLVVILKGYELWTNYSEIALLQNFGSLFLMCVLIADDEQSKMESSSSSFDSYYPEITKVIYIVNDYPGYEVLSIVISHVNLQ